MLQANSLTAEMQPQERIRGQPMMVFDLDELDTYPGAIFSQPGKAPGETLDGFVAVDPDTGEFLPIAAPAPGQATVEVATIDPDECEADHADVHQSRQLSCVEQGGWCNSDDSTRGQCSLTRGQR